MRQPQGQTPKGEGGLDDVGKGADREWRWVLYTYHELASPLKAGEGLFLFPHSDFRHLEEYMETRIES
jgi:hypothetical protein